MNMFIDAEVIDEGEAIDHLLSRVGLSLPVVVSLPEEIDLDTASDGDLMMDAIEYVVQPGPRQQD